jgi:dipeptidyl-peptidase 4
LPLTKVARAQVRPAAAERSAARACISRVTLESRSMSIAPPFTARVRLPAVLVYVFTSLVITPLVAVRAQDAAAPEEKKRLTIEDTYAPPTGFMKLKRERWTWSPGGTVLRQGSRYFDPKTGEPTQAPQAESRPAGDRGAQPRRRPQRASGESLTAPSPDGARTSFIREKNLWVRDEASAEEAQISTDGSEELLYGRLDWVYQEEVFGRGDFNAMWWSTDSKRLAYMRIDESPVHEFTVTDDIPSRGRLETVNYPKAGDPNPIATLWVYDCAALKSVEIDISRYKDSEPLIVRVGWTPDGSKVLYEVQDRLQTWLDLNLGDPATGASTTLIHETSPSWINRQDSEARFLADGTFLWRSERTGYAHYYHYRLDGQLIRALNEGPWEDGDIVRLDEQRGLLWFYGRQHGATGRHAYRLDYKNGGAAVHLTPERGTHTVSLSADGGMLIDDFSNLEMPGRSILRDGEGRVVRVLDETVAVSEFELAPVKLVEIPARDGFLMDATIMMPIGFDAAKSYPVLLPTYSGPNAPTVHDAFRPDPFLQFLTHAGVIVLQVNNRTSSGKGQVYTGACYKRFGVSELEDLEDAVAWLCKNPWADKTRVGIRGWSYGGFMAGYALTHSKSFALGLAGAGVYDWRLYDTIYTERYMSTPEKNPEGYAISSCIAAARNLHGHLQLAHGSMDDNVHMQNSIQFAYELQLAGKDFEMMIYPKSRHGLGAEIADMSKRAKPSEHYRRFEWSAIQRVLRPGR